MPLLDGPSLGGNARHVLRQYAEESALARGRAANAAGTEEFGGGCLRGRYNNLREVIQNNPSLVVVPSIINAGGLFVQRPICRTNYLPNNSMAGATGGVLPTNWSIASLPAGITVSYSASGTAVAADGTSVNYIDVTVSGTAGASGFLNIRPNPSSSTIAAFVGQTYNTSVYLQLISGSVTSISPTWQLQELNSSQTFLQGSNIGGLGSLVVGGQFDRYNVSRVLTESTTAFVTCRWGHSLVSGTTYSYTLRIGSPQLERFSVPTPMIATSTGAVTRLNESTNVVGLPPDFSVSRNTGATRVGPNGLIEAGNTNLAFHSESWVSGNNWGLLGITNATGAIAAPNGTITANALSPTAASGAHFMTGNNSTTVSYTSGTIYTQSAFFKAGTGAAGQLVQLTFTSAAFTQAGYANFDLSAGTVLVVSGTTADANRAARIENYGNGWYRCIFTATCNSTGAGVSLIPVLITASGSGRTPSFTGVTGDILYGWGAQLETGSTASEYIPTTTVARTRFAGVTVDGTIAANIPRIDWLGQSCPGLLVEPSAQNLVLRSEEFDNASWSKTDITVTTGSTSAFTAPDGTTNADLFTSTASGNSFLAQTITIASGAATFSVFAKAGNHGIFRIGNVSSAARAAWFDLNAGAVIGTVNGGTASIQNYGSGWYRCIFTASSVVSGGSTFIIAISDAANGTASVSGATMYAWGAQLETGSIATTYIPTTSGTVSRAADVISASGALVSGLIGQTEGTMYFQIRDLKGLATGTGNPALAIRNTAFTNWIGLTSNSVSTPFRITVRSTTTTLIDYTSAITEGKVAIAYSASGAVVYVNGSGVASTATNPNLTLNIVVMEQYMPFKVESLALYTTRLTDAQLAELTRL